MKRVAFIVEGHGEEAAVPVLARRFQEICGKFDSEILRPIRVHKQRFLVRREERLRFLLLAKGLVGEGGHVVVLLDADDDCPAELVAKFYDEMREVVAPSGFGFVIAKREFEGWFLAGIESLGGRRGLLPNTVCDDEPEGIRNAKGWLSERMPRSQPYSETLDQPALAQALDLSLARSRAASFDKFCREMCRALE